MARRLCVLVVAALALMIQAAAAQDARATLQAASAAMGAANLRSVQITGTGWNAAVGQSFSPEEDWPRFEVTRYTRTIDYEGRSSREELTRRQGNNPPRGGGGTPLQGEQQQVAIVSGNYAWNMNGQMAVPQPGLYMAGVPVAEFRQLDLLLTPHGFLKAALAPNANPTAISLTLGSPTGAVTPNGKATLVSFTAMGKYKVVRDVQRPEPARTGAHVGSQPGLRRHAVRAALHNYKDFGGVKFPTLLHIHQGDPRLSVAHNSMEITVTGVQPNVAVTPIPVPDAVRTATAPPVRAESQRLADGIWLVGRR